MEHHQTGFANETDRFGAVPDEIDTTPTDDKHAPGAPSAPVWSLQDDIPDTTPQDDEQPKAMSSPRRRGGGSVLLVVVSKRRAHLVCLPRPSL